MCIFMSVIFYQMLLRVISLVLWYPKSVLDKFSLKYYHYSADLTMIWNWLF